MNEAKLIDKESKLIDWISKAYKVTKKEAAYVISGYPDYIKLLRHLQKNTPGQTGNWLIKQLKSIYPDWKGFKNVGLVPNVVFKKGDKVQFIPRIKSYYPLRWGKLIKYNTPYIIHSMHKEQNTRNNSADVYLQGKSINDGGIVVYTAHLEKFKGTSKISGVKRKFGVDVEGAGDITKINKIIRGDINSLKTYPAIKKKVSQSRYLYTLSFTDNWKKDLYGRIRSVRTRAKNEYCKTLKDANKRLKTLNIHKIFTSKDC